MQEYVVLRNDAKPRSTYSTCLDEEHIRDFALPYFPDEKFELRRLYQDEDGFFYKDANDRRRISLQNMIELSLTEFFDIHCADNLSSADRMGLLENWFQRCENKGQSFARDIREHLSIYKQTVDLMNQNAGFL